MRRDMKEVIVETARTGGGYYRGQGHRPLRDDEGFVDLPSHEKMRYRKDKSQGDKLGPLRAFLESKVGQQWDDVYSEICEVNDKRSMLGFHLLTHLSQYVKAKGLHSKHSYFGQDFFQDYDGTLQKAKDNRPWYRQRAEEALKAPIERFLLEDGWRYQKEKGQWYRMKEVQVPDTVLWSEYIDEEKYEIVRVVKPVTRAKYLKFQCNRKEMRKVRELVAEEIAKRRRKYFKALARSER